jgi:polyketide biosynthesis enoyl-CoA hydratase PksH
MERVNFETIRVRLRNTVCFVEFYRPGQRNAINAQMIEEFHRALDLYSDAVTAVVVEGNPQVFSMGADFGEITTGAASHCAYDHDPEPLFRLWERMVQGPFISVAHVRGRANAGGLGFIAAADIVLADATAEFSLSELLFNLLPGCVLPFLVRRVGFQHARYLALSTRPITVHQAYEWGLVDAYDENSETLLRIFLSRIKRISGTAIRRCKHYLNDLEGGTDWAKARAVAATREAFSDPCSLSNIARYVQSGLFPWEE